jgi:hypothetical protein
VAPPIHGQHKGPFILRTSWNWPQMAESRCLSIPQASWVGGGLAASHPNGHT